MADNESEYALLVARRRLYYISSSAFGGEIKIITRWQVYLAVQLPEKRKKENLDIQISECCLLV